MKRIFGACSRAVVFNGDFQKIFFNPRFNENFAARETRSVLRRNALTVWLRADLATVLRRVRSDGRRPLAGNREIMSSRLAEREAAYREADITVETSDVEPDAVAERVVSAVRERVE